MGQQKHCFKRVNCKFTVADTYILDEEQAIQLEYNSFKMLDKELICEYTNSLR